MDFGEADRLLTVLSPSLGKLRVLAKGVRRPSSHMAGHVELFAHTHLQLARGRDLDIVTQASTIEPFRTLRENMVKVAHAFHLAELCDGFLQDADPHPAVFGLLLSTLHRLAGDDYRASFAARAFELHLLQEVGYRPDLTTCLRCQSRIEPGANSYSVSLGGAVCPQCALTVPDAGPISSDVLKLLRHLQRTPNDRLRPVAVSEAVLREAERVMRRHLEFALERRLQASDFVRQATEAMPAAG